MGPVSRYASSRRTMITCFVLVLALGLAVAGCSDSGGSTSVSESTTIVGEVTTSIGGVSTTTEAPAATSSTLDVDASEEVLPSGHARACGIITEVWMDGAVRKLEIDYVDFLSGDEAESAAIDDGVIAPGDYIEYYARNNNPMLRTFTVSDSVLITTYSRETPIDLSDAPCSWEDFYDFWNLAGPPVPSDIGLSDGLWWIERDSAGIVAIEQQWVP